MGHPYGWRHGRSIAAAPRKSNAMLPKSAVCLSKKKARRDALPDHFIVALMHECIKADMHNEGYVPQQDAAIDALLVLGLSDYLRDRDAVKVWVRDQVRHGWVSGSFCVDSIRVAHGPVRGVGGTFRRRDDHSHQAWVDRVRVIKAADAKLMTPPQLAQLLAAVTNITRKEERTEHPASHETQRAAQLPHATDVADDAHTGSANEPVAFPRLRGGSSTLSTGK